MPSNRYAIAPTEDSRVSAEEDSLVVPDNGHDLYDDEDEDASASQPLLPAGPRNEGDATESLRIRSSRWIRTQIRSIHGRCQVLQKRNTVRRIAVTATVASLLLLTAGLAISTGILARELSHARHVWAEGKYADHETRLPWSWGTYMDPASHNFNLPLNLIYPPLTADSEASCKDVWSQVGTVACHEKVLNRAWDDGKPQSLFEPRYDIYADAIADERCLHDLESLYSRLTSECTLKDVFDMTTYLGPMRADPHLEEGPVKAIQTVLARVRHTARKVAPIDHYEHWPDPHCVSELYQFWFIVDGMNSNNFNGLDTFLTLTDALEAGGHDDNKARLFPTDLDDGGVPRIRASWLHHWYDFGPSDGDTQCSWCLLNWFDRKLQAWEEGKVLDPVNGTAVSLPTFLRRIEKAGRRCQSEDWSRIYRKNVWMYQERGWLPDDWQSDTLATPPVGNDGSQAVL